MSESTPCNFCYFQRTKRQLEKRGHKVKLVDSKEMPGWKAIEIDGKEHEGTYYKEVSTHCVC